MTNPEEEKIFSLKEQMLDNFTTLEDYVDECTEEGMADPGSELYNEIVTLIEDLDELNTLPELEVLSFRGKTIENRIDIWLASQGRNSIELAWPIF